MAYWLLCPSCKEWSKSATPLSNDKFCPLCNKPLVTERSYISSIPGTVEKTSEPQSNSQMPESNETEPAIAAIETVEPVQITEPSEAPAAKAIPEIDETTEASATPDEPETEDIPEAIEDSEILDQPEEEETIETPEASATQESSEEPENVQTGESQEAQKAPATREKQNYFLQKRKKPRIHR